MSEQAPRVTLKNDSVRYVIALADIDHGIRTPLDPQRGRLLFKGVERGHLERVDGEYRLTAAGKMFLNVVRKRICSGVLYFNLEPSVETVAVQVAP